MDAVIKYYGERSPHWLSELTHKERPWKDARKGYARGGSLSRNHYERVNVGVLWGYGGR